VIIRNIFQKRFVLSRPWMNKTELRLRNLRKYLDEVYYNHDLGGTLKVWSFEEGIGTKEIKEYMKDKQ